MYKIVLLPDDRMIQLMFEVYVKNVDIYDAYFMLYDFLGWDKERLDNALINPTYYLN